MSDDIKIYGKLTNATTDNVLAGADQIYDSYQKQFQQDINKLIPKLESEKIPSKYLPSYVDDVLEGKLIDIRTFETTGEPQQTGVIYLDTETNISYRWSGSQYVKISSPLELGTTASTALAGSEGIKNVQVSPTSEEVNVSLAKNSGTTIDAILPVASTSSAGVMSASDKSIVNNANTLLSNSPLVDKLQFTVSNNKRQLQYKNNGDTTFTSIQMPAFGEKLLVIADKSLNNREDCYLYLQDLSGNFISTVTLPVVTDNHNGLMTPNLYHDLRDAYSLSNNLIGTKIHTLDIGYRADEVDLSLLSNQGDPIEGTLSTATTSSAGVMSATDKTKLDTLDWYFEE